MRRWQILSVVGTCIALTNGFQAHQKKTVPSFLAIMSNGASHHVPFEDPASSWNRRQFLMQSMLPCGLLPGLTVSQASEAFTATTQGYNQSIASVVQGREFHYRDDWIGTHLPLLNLEQSVGGSSTTAGSWSSSKAYAWPMARWPDPILRRPAQDVNQFYLEHTPELLMQVGDRLRATALNAYAVGLAAQQCGVDARIVYLSIPRSLRSQVQFRSGTSSTALIKNGVIPSDLIMINPRIINRSPELEIKVWNEQCLVLPPTFTATVLRDAWIDVQYQTSKTGSRWYMIRLFGELSRAAQHELDHDRGILVTDHVSLEELECDVMRQLEAPGHDDRMQLAYAREVANKAV